MSIKTILKKVLSIALFFIAFLLVPIPAIATTYVVFRYDDFSADKPSERKRNALRMRIWEAEQEIDQLFAKYDMQYIIAIIPYANAKYDYGRGTSNFSKTCFGEDYEKIELIKHGIKTGRIEAAQHGFSHTNHAKDNHKHGEFRERNYMCQLEDIKQGKDILCESLNLPSIKTFVPPFNGWDKNTAKALMKMGFGILSVDRYYYHKAAKDLTVIPFTAQLWDLESIVEQGNLADGAIVVVLYHPPQIAELAGLEHRHFGTERFDRLLRKLSTFPDVKVTTLQQLAQECDSLTINRYRAANSLWRQRNFWAKLLPQHLWPGESSRPIYLATELYTQQVKYWRMLTIALATGLLFAGLTVKYLIRLVFSAKWRWQVDIAASVLCCVSIMSEIYLAYRGYHPTAIRAIPAIFTTSFLVALILRLVRKPVWLA